MALRGQDDTETRESGKNKLFEIHGPVFWPSVILVTALIVGTLLAGEAAEEVFNSVRVGITEWASWLFVASVNLFIGFALYFAFSRFGKIRIGGEGAEPEFSNMAWFAMLFSAGMGIGLMFFAVAEPMWHLLYPPHAEAGMEYVFGLENTITLQVIIIVVVTGVAVISVVLGIEKGVKVLSEFNIRLAGLFLLFILVFGPTLYILGSFVQNTGYYIQNFASYATWTQIYEDGEFMTTWTVFYWAWWISWSPYVGMFIARISKGRTVKEFVLGVLIVPTILTFLWMSSFGGSALFLETGGIAEIAAAVEADQTTSLFILLDQFPMAIITSFLAIILILSFFVTSSDSGSLVIDGLTSGGKLNSPVGQRIFWATTEGVVAAVLLIGGGLGALQAGAISTGLPFVIVLLIMCYSLQKGLSREHRDLMKIDKDKDRESYRELVQKAIQKQKKTD